jgi:hypothetical protein
MLSFRGGGAAHEPGTYEHRTADTLEMPVFLGSGLGPSDRPGMTFLEMNNFFTRFSAGATGRGNGKPLSGSVQAERWTDPAAAVIVGR